jgi:hypothetical protein
MLQRDFLMRQVNQLAQVLAQLMGLDTAQRESLGEQWLSEAVEQVTGTDLKRLRHASLSELESICTRGGILSTDLAVALADVLMEDARIQDSCGRSEESWAAAERALSIYRLARDAGGALPIAVLERL